MELFEVSVVTFPAYEETSVSARRRDFDEIKKRQDEARREKIRKKLKGEKHGTESNAAEEED